MEIEKEKYKIGDKVKHDRFGEGTITDIVKMGRTDTFIIKFKDGLHHCTDCRLKYTDEPDEFEYEYQIKLRIKEKMKEKGITYRMISKATGLKETSVKRYLLKEFNSHLPLHFVRNVCYTFKLDMNYICGVEYE